MATISETQDAVASCSGFERDHVRQIGDVLAGAWDAPAADGANYPELQPHYTTLLLLALAANAKPTDAAAVAEKYYNLRNTDHNSVPTAGEMLEVLLLTFYSGGERDIEAQAFHSEFEVCHATSGIRWMSETTDGPKPVVFLGSDVQGLLLSFERVNDYVRRSCKIPGRVLYRIANELKHRGPIQHVTVPLTDVVAQ